MSEALIASRNSFNPEEYLNVERFYLEQPVFFTIIQIDDISRSNIRRLDEWQEVDDPNNILVDRVGILNKKKAGSRIIREIQDSNDSNEKEINLLPVGIHRLVLQDKDQHHCFAYEYNDELAFLRRKRTEAYPFGIPLGSSIIVHKGAMAVRGVLFLVNAHCEYIGVVDANRETAELLNSNLVKRQILYLEKELKMKRT